MAEDDDDWYNEEPRKKKFTCCGWLGKDRKVRTFFGWGITLFIVAIILIVLAWVFAYVLWPDGYRLSVLAQVIIDSPSSAGYSDYLSSDSPDLPPFYELWYFFNVTNHEAIIEHGAKPELQQVGPYIFTQLKTKYNVTFPENGNVAAFRECQTWFYDPEITAQHGCVHPISGEPCNAETDIILNLNPAYMGAIANAGGELPLTQAFSGPALAEVFVFLQTVFLDDTIARHSTTNLLQEQEKLTENDDSDAFYATWANETVPPSAGWDDMLVSLSSTPSGISLESAEMLFDSKQEYSLTNTEEASYEIWAETVGYATGMYNSSSKYNSIISSNSNERGSYSDNIQFLSDTFRMTTEQTTMVVQWLRNHFYPHVVEPALVDQEGVGSLWDLAYIQWGTAGIAPLHESVQKLYPGRNFPSKPEFFSWSNGLSHMQWENAKKLLAGPLGLFGANNWAIFAEFAGAPVNETAIEQLWGIQSTAQLRSLELYFANFADKYAQPDMVKLADEGGGLFTARTPNQWAWKALDPLLLVLQPADADVALQGNDSSLPVCMKQQAIDYYLTGKNHTDSVGQQLTYEGMSVFNFYPVPYHVHGTNSEGQFEPFLKPGTPLEVFDNNFFRTLQLEHITNLTIRGVYVYRYSLALSNFAVPQPDFDMQDGFQGLVNMTGPQKGAPIYLSQAHWYGVEKSWHRKVKGMPDPDPSLDPTFVDIEPYTGKAVRTWQALQVNIYVPETPDFFAFSPFGHENMPRDVMFPVTIIRQFSELNDDNADQIKDELYFGFKLQKILFGVFWGVGVALLAAGVSLSYVSYRRWLRLRKEPLDGFLADPLGIADASQEPLIDAPLGQHNDSLYHQLSGHDDQPNHNSDSDSDPYY